MLLFLCSLSRDSQKKEKNGAVFGVIQLKST